MASLSPMMQQYFDIKAQHEDCVLFFRLGDFYEMFFDDAVNISKELELTLTGKDCGMTERAPMCGIPYHACDGYIKRLIDKGYKVAICEQIEDPALSKGLVKRDVTKIVTPGTVIESELLNEEKNNYIASIVISGRVFSVCFADVSTGDVYITSQSAANVSIEVINELSKFAPSEILFNEELVKHKEIGEFIKHKLGCVCEMYTDDELDESRCIKTLLGHFKGRSLEDLSVADKPEAIKALGGLLDYIAYTRKNGVIRISSINFYNQEQYMNIDVTARRNLEITQTMRSNEKRGTLLWVLDKTKTAMGKRYIRKALEQPLRSLSEITRRQSAVTELFNSAQLRDEIGEMLGSVYDMERLMTRVIYGSVTPRDVKALAFTLSKLPEIKALVSGFSCQYLKDVADKIADLSDVEALINNAIADEPPVNLKDGNVIKSGFNADLDELRELCGNAKGFIAKIEEKERERTGIPKLKVGYNRVFGYYIEITNSYLQQAPDDYIRKQTLVGGERFITQELKDLEAKVLSANERILALESDIFGEIKKFIASRIDLIQSTASSIAKLDFALSLSVVAAENNYVCPEVTIGDSITIKDGRHPVIEKLLKSTLFVPNDVLLDGRDNRLLMITGPNMAGKSTYMRQTALITIMAQIGSFVPAASATIGICDKIFTRVGASDDLSLGQSTFMVEMTEIAYILKNATPKSLVIIDEIGRGTSTYDGMSIAKAVASYLVENKKLGCKTMFATHYHELTELENEIEGIKNYNIAVKKRGEDIIFLRKIVRGGTDDSYGIEVAKLAGVPQPVIDNAKEVLSRLEAGEPKAVTVVKPDDNQNENQQLDFASSSATELAKAVEKIDVNTLTPIEALNILYELKKLI